MLSAILRLPARELLQSCPRNAERFAANATNELRHLSQLDCIDGPLNCALRSGQRKISRSGTDDVVPLDPVRSGGTDARPAHDLDRSSIVAFEHSSGPTYLENNHGDITGQGVNIFEARVGVAARCSRIAFNESSTFGNWDWDVNRWKRSVAYRITLHADIMASYTLTSDVGPADPRDNLTVVGL
jgi:hypothetical protein